MDYYYPFPAGTPMSQAFGANPNNGVNPAGGHNGDDWAVPVGTPVRAAGDGVILYAGEFDDSYADNWGWNLNYGGTMVIINTDGANGPYFEYGHLSKALVAAGDRVTAGQVIALSGNTDGGTGVSTGPHCHVGCLEPNFDLGTDTYGRVNPRKYMNTWWTGLSAATIESEGTEMSASEVQEIKEFVQAAHDVTRNLILDKVASAVLDKPVQRQGKGVGLGAETSLGQVVAWFDNANLSVIEVAGVDDAGAIAERLIAQFGESLAGDIVSAVGQRLAAVK